MGGAFSSSESKISFANLSDAIAKESTSQFLFDRGDDFVFESDEGSHVYKPRVFKLFRGVLLVEKNKKNMIVLSLPAFGLRKFPKSPSPMAYRFHLTVVRKTFDENREFHVSVEKFVKAKNGTIRASKFCSDFYRFEKSSFERIESRSKRKNCDRFEEASVRLAGAFSKTISETPRNRRVP